MDQRFYASAYGRFTTTDLAPPQSGDPGTWNRYSYTNGDPVNRFDPGGSDWLDSNECISWEWDPSVPGNPRNSTNFPYSGMPGGIPGCGNIAPSQFNPGIGMACLEILALIPSLAQQTSPPRPSCAISVASSGTPRGLQDVTSVGASSNQLGAYKSGGWYFAVQIQANLEGDADGSDWVLHQSGTVTGFVRPDSGAPAQTVNINTPDDRIASTFVNQGPGTFDWIDAPGVSGVQTAFLNFNFTSSLRNKFTGATCSVNWSMQLQADGDKWRFTFGQ